MADLANILQIPTTHAGAYKGDVTLSPNAVQAAQIYYQQQPVYVNPSWVSATGVVRPQHVVAAVEVYTEAPTWNQYDVPVVWLGNTNGGYAAPIGYSVAAQKARTFGGYSPPYYQAVKAPSISDVAQFMGGVIQNGR